MQHRELRSDRGSRLVNEFFLKLAFFNIHDTFKAGDWSSYVFLKLVYLTNHDTFNCVKRKRWPDKNARDQCGIDHHPAIVSSERVERQERGDPYSSETSEELLNKPTKNPKRNKNEDHEQVRRDPCHSEKPEWLQEFRENLVDDRVPERRDSHASSSHESSLERLREVWICGKHSVYTHFPKDRNCEICQRTKITRAPCRRRIGRVVPRAENFGDLITADHKVLSDNCESRNNHRYAVVVQDLATQWIQAYPCKNKTSQETQRSLQKFLEPERKPKVIYTDNSLEFGKACEDLSWNHGTSTPHRSETNGIAERAVRRVKEGASAVLLQSGLDEKWWADSMECFSYLRNILVWWENSIGETLWETILRTDHSVWFTGWVLPYFCERKVKNPSIWKESLTWIVPWIRIVRGWNLEGWHIGCRHWGVGNDGRIGNLLEKKTQCKGSNIFTQKWKIHVSSRRWTNQIYWRRSGTENIHLDTGISNSRRKQYWLSWRIRRVSSSTTSRLTSGCRWSDKWFFGPCQETSFSAITLNPESNFTRREKNHSLFHWNILTYPELQERIWMLCKKAASMTIGISMDQEICLIRGQVSLSSLY